MDEETGVTSALTKLLWQHARDQDQRAAGEEDDRRLFPEGAQPPSNWSTYDQENGSSEEPVHVSGSSADNDRLQFHPFRSGDKRHQHPNDTDPAADHRWFLAIHSSGPTP
jgi:hypothetical protein